MNRIALACAITVGAALYSLYGLFILTLLLRVDVSQLDAVESIIVIAMAGRFLALMAIFAVKRTIPVALLLLFGAEVVIMMGVLGFYLVIGISVPVLLLHSVITAVITTFVAGLPACLIFLSTFEMVRTRRIARVLLSVLLEIALLYFMTGHLSQVQSSITLSGFPQFVVLSARDDIAAGTIPQISDSFAILPLTAIYCSLLIYARLPGDGQRVPTRMTLALPLLSTLVALGLLFFTAFYLPSAFSTFSMRTIVGVALLLVSFAAIRLLSERASSRRPTIVAHSVYPIPEMSRREKT